MDGSTNATPENTVLLLGGTGRTGGRVLSQCVERGVGVRAVVRSVAQLPKGASDEPLVTVIEADPLSMTTAEWQRHLQGCDAVISCLGHTTNLRGVYGPPFDVVTGTISHVIDALQAIRPARPMRVILMSSVSVNRPAKADTRRGAGERIFVSAVRFLVPPARDNQRAADLLAHDVGSSNPYIEWVVVRPDTLRDGDVSDYQLSHELVNGIFRPGETNMSNVAHFMCDLATDDVAWRQWRGCMPVVVNAVTRTALAGIGAGESQGMART